MPVGREGLPRMEMSQELLLLGSNAPSARSAQRTARVGRLFLMAHMDSANSPEVLAVVTLPSEQERRRREVMLARLMLVATDLVLSGEPLGLETARDLVREIKHTFPELAAEWSDL